MNRILLAFSLLCSLNTLAQTGGIKGKVIHDDTKLPYVEVSVTIPKAKVSSVTDASGDFIITNIPEGNYDMVLSPDGIYEQTVQISITKGITDQGVVELKSITTNVNNFTLENSGSNVEDATSDDNNVESSAGQNISSVLNASRDPYLSAATFGWGQYFYRIRGYENENNVLYMNGVPMNDLEEGGVFFNSWSGLNDVFRGRTLSLGLAPVDFNFGGMGLNTSLDATASNQRKGTRLTYTATNRSYKNRLMLTHNSGLMKNGWAYSLSFSKRWAQRGPVKGTYYDAYGYFGAVEKRFKKQGFSLMVVGAPIRRGKAGAATKEAFDLAGTNYYNPNWGYQNGEIRNTRELTTHAPLFAFTHDARLSENTQITSAIAYQAGETATTTLDWYNSADPRPDYYRYMPSFQEADSTTQLLNNLVRSNPDKYLQVDWDGLYEANYLNKKAGSGRASYILGADVEKTRKLNAAVNLQSVVNSHIVFYTGIGYQNQRNHNFRRVEDLLGANYWLNINQFAEDGIQGTTVSTALDMDEKDSVKRVGDTYGYNYYIYFQRANWWAQSTFTYNKFDFFLGAEIGYTNFYRDGLYKHGLYPTDSKGKSNTNTFFNYRTKGGITYKLNGRNYLYANGSFGTRAPYVDNVVVSARTRNQIIDGARNEDVSSFELGYLLRSPNIKARATFFASEVKNASDIKRFFNDFGASFTNYVIQNINKRYTGLEVGAEIKISPSFSLNLAGAYTQAFYTSRATARVYNDNDFAIGLNSVSEKVDTLYIKNFYVPSGPQTAFQAQLTYRSKRFWFANIAFNYLANNWIDFAPSRRTIEGVDLLKYKSQEWSAVIDQQRLPSFYTVDLFGGKSWKVNRYIKKASNNTFLNLNIGLTNVLNNRNIIQYGFENLRVGGPTAQPDWFVPRYGYALGIQYFINTTLRF